jgi:2-keto-4-pentenoate hydratase/2-oxohepta-3-ene-1,7-dioic acid hydratase in catechol pathway
MNSQPSAHVGERGLWRAKSWTSALSRLPTESVLDVLKGGARRHRSEPSWPLSQVTLLAPIAIPRAIYGIGLNYAQHARETGAQRPENPIVFAKVPGPVAPRAVRILTGTPNGVGMALDPPRFLESGDVIRIEIERLGAIEHAVT